MKAKLTDRMNDLTHCFDEMAAYDFPMNISDVTNKGITIEFSFNGHKYVAVDAEEHRINQALMDEAADKIEELRRERNSARAATK